VKKDKGLTEANAKFCNAVAIGDKPIKQCLIEAYPKYAKAKTSVIESQAHRLVTRPDIIAEIARLKEVMGAKTEEKYAGLKEEMIDRAIRGIREGTDGDPLTIVEFSKTLDFLAKCNGWYAPTDVNVRNGGYTADYRPPTLMTMSDEEITEKLALLRGKKK